MKIGSRSSIAALVALLSLSAGNFPAEAESRAQTCARLLWRKTSSTLGPYVREVKSTHGLRLFLKRSDILALSRLKYGGFMEIRRQTNRLTRFLPRYRMTPIGGLYHQLVRRPAWYLSDQIGVPKFEPAFWLRFPLGVALFVASYSEADSVYDYALTRHVQNGIEDNAAFYNDLIASDYRYHSIRDKLNAGLLTPKEARVKAYETYFTFNRYYAYDATADESDLGAQMRFLENPLFSHLKSVFQNGVQAAPGIITGHTGPLTDGQKLRLIQINHDLYLQYEVIAEFARGGQMYSRFSRQPKFAGIVHSLYGDVFDASLIKDRDENRMTSQDLEYLLQEDAFWKTRFEEWKTIGVVRLKRNDDGTPSATPLTLDEIRREFIDDWQTAVHAGESHRTERGP